MQVSISVGNRKMGAVPNVSLTPGASCAPGAPCYADGCYARKVCRYAKPAAAAYARNLNIFQTAPERFMDEVYSWIRLHRPAFFRWHVSGDIPTLGYWEGMCSVAELVAANQLPTKMLCFTKRTDILTPEDLDQAPDNLRVVISRWPGLELPAGFEEFPQAWLAEDERRPEASYPCAGNCQACGMCWKLGANESVSFVRH